MSIKRKINLKINKLLRYNEMRLSESSHTAQLQLAITQDSNEKSTRPVCNKGITVYMPPTHGP